ncbi:MAG: hypothetical protein LBH98_09925 [Chitinispirillales bacterium]|nr:hypothetical protein [Chitinispirillales bacterium]
MRFSGDFFLNPGFHFDNDYYYTGSYYDDDYYGPNKNVKVDYKSNTFNIQYAWNTRLGLDFGDNLSVDFRLSNPGGYGNDNLAFKDGNAKGYIPTLPNAYITWKPGSLFKFYGGLLETKGNTVLDLVAGFESMFSASDFDVEDLYDVGGGYGLWTSFWNWDCEYNSSQAGLKFGFDFSDKFSLNLTTALVSPANALGDAYYIVYEDGVPVDIEYYYYNHNEFRFILDADIGLGEKVTLSPVFQTRSFWGTYYDYSNRKNKASVLLAYGTDIDFAFNDKFNFNVGVALGNIRLGKSYVVNYDTWGDDIKSFGFLVKAAPSLTLGINELAFNYSLGTGNVKLDEGVYGTYKESFVCNDLYFGWHFLINDNIAFGPAVQLAFRSDKLKATYESIKSTDKIGGYNYINFGLEFVARF